MIVIINIIYFTVMILIIKEDFYNNINNYPGQSRSISENIRGVCTSPNAAPFHQSLMTGSFDL